MKHCPNGHEVTPETTYRIRRGAGHYEGCKICRSDQKRAYLQRQRERELTFGDLLKAAHRFWSKVSVGDEDACWMWSASREGGYGRFRVAGRLIKAHRVALALKLARLVDVSLEALHSCDTPACCNPNHLREGTHAENMADMAQRGRARSGWTTGRARRAA